MHAKCTNKLTVCEIVQYLNWNNIYLNLIKVAQQLATC